MRGRHPHFWSGGGSDLQVRVAHMAVPPESRHTVKALMKKEPLLTEEGGERCDSLGIDYLVAHIGSHMGREPMVGVRNVAEACDEASRRATGKTVLLLENMAGHEELRGPAFEELS